MVPKTWPWYATSPSIWSAKSLTSDRSSAAESAPPGTRNTCWKSSARCGRNLVNLDSLPCAIEERIVEEMRLLGREAMQGWAETQVEATEKEIRQQPSMHRQGKKNSAGIRNLAKSRF